MIGESLYEIGDTVYKLGDPTAGVIRRIRIEQGPTFYSGEGPAPESEGGPKVVTYKINFDGNYRSLLETQVTDILPT